MNAWLRRKPMSGPLGDARRAGTLLIFGMLHIVYGAGYFSTDRADTHTLIEALTVFARVVGPETALPFAGALWIASGACAVLAAFIPPGRDAWGFQVMVFIDCAWACLYMAGWVFGQNTRGWAQALLFLGFAAALQLISGMVSARNVRKIQDGTAR